MVRPVTVIILAGEGASLRLLALGAVVEGPAVRLGPSAVKLRMTEPSSGPVTPVKFTILVSAPVA